MDAEERMTEYRILGTLVLNQGRKRLRRGVQRGGRKTRREWGPRGERGRHPSRRAGVTVQ